MSNLAPIHERAKIGPIIWAWWWSRISRKLQTGRRFRKLCIHYFTATRYLILWYFIYLTWEGCITILMEIFINSYRRERPFINRIVRFRDHTDWGRSQTFLRSHQLRRGQTFLKTIVLRSEDACSFLIILLYIEIIYFNLINPLIKQLKKELVNIGNFFMSIGKLIDNLSTSCKCICSFSFLSSAIFFFSWWLVQILVYYGEIGFLGDTEGKLLSLPGKIILFCTFKNKL